MPDAGHIAAQTSVRSASGMMTAVVMPVVVVAMIMWMMPVVIVVAPTIGPVGIPAPVGVVGITPVASPVGTVAPAPTHVNAWVIVPIERVVVVGVDVIGVPTGVVVIVIASR